MPARYGPGKCREVPEYELRMTCEEEGPARTYDSKTGGNHEQCCGGRHRVQSKAVRLPVRYCKSKRQETSLENYIAEYMVGRGVYRTHATFALF